MPLGARLLAAAATAALAASACMVQTTTTKPPGTGEAMEPGVNRPGGDYKDFDLEEANPGICQVACKQEAECVAWTYVNPGVQGDRARCWLKNTVPPPQQEGCCTSGVK